MKLFCQYRCPNSTLANIDLFPTSSTSTTVANNGGQNFINSGVTIQPPVPIGLNPSQVAGIKPLGNNPQKPAAGAGAGPVPLTAGSNPAVAAPEAAVPPAQPGGAETPPEGAPAPGGPENPPPEAR